MISLLESDVVTLDIEIPEMDGLETLRQIRKLYPELIVIMFSTLSERGAAVTREALALGANEYVTPALRASLLALRPAARLKLDFFTVREPR